MRFTGERVIPGEGDADLLNEHRARYLFAQRYSAGKSVLDVACGTGYGSALLGEKAAAVFGVDLSAEAVHHARRHYGSPKVHFAQSGCLTLPFPSGQFDLVAAFEIIEHLEDPEAFLAELQRVLQPAGLLLLSTPNRLYYTEERGEVNPFHVREFSFAELEETLKPLFPHRAILFENHVAGLMVSGPGAEANFQEHSADSILQEETDAAASSGESKDEREKAAHYFVALCSNQPLDPARPLLYLPSTGNVLQEREMHIRSLTDHLALARAQVTEAQQREHELEQLLEERTRWAQELDRLLEERTRWARKLDRQLSEKAEYIRQLQADHENKVQWALGLQQEMEQARAALQKREQEFEERTQWALSLQQEMEQARAALQKLQQEFEERTAWALNLNGELQQRREELRLLYGSRWYRIGKNLRLSPVPASDQKPPPVVKPKDQ